MNRIGFKNFKRFQDFQPIELSGVTFLVGRNNSGKSTLIKALLLICNYWKNPKTDNFSFVDNVLENETVLSYGRAKNERASEDKIKFVFGIDHYYTEVTIYSKDEDSLLAEIESFILRDLENRLEFKYEESGCLFTITKTDIPNQKEESTNNSNINLLEEEIKRLRSEIDNSEIKKTTEEIKSLEDEYNALVQKRELIISDTAPDPSIIYSIRHGVDYDFSFDEMISFALYMAESAHGGCEEDMSNEEKEQHYAVHEDSKVIYNSFKKFFELVNNLSISYLGINSIKQSTIFLIRDKNNVLAQSIHDFYLLKTTSNNYNKAYRFVEKWMEIFEIGYDFDINRISTEAYEMIIRSKGAYIHLTDKGSGSVQVMKLILRIAYLISVNGNNKIVIVEEPEINLHPALQSRLTDLFLEASQTYKLNLIIETHSEYILRRSQVLVAEKDFTTNPFSVYYFPNELNQQPYRLNYQADGTFDRNFGKGFFDEASLSTLKLLKLKRLKKD